MSKTILLIEDHADTRELTSRLLTKRGYVVRAAAGAREAREILKDCRPAVVLSDIALGDGDGCELLKEFRDQFPTVRGIAVTGRVYPDDVARCRAAGFSAFIPKPVDLNKLIAAIETALLPDRDSDTTEAQTATRV